MVMSFTLSPSRRLPSEYSNLTPVSEMILSSMNLVPLSVPAII